MSSSAHHHSNHFSFTYNTYRRFLAHLRGIAPVIRLKDAREQEGSYVVMRHDVDFEISPTHMLSKIEREAMVPSTYFIMTTCDFYNPAAPDNRALLLDMVNAGFEIGLHFDPTVYGTSDIEDLSVEVNREANWLASLTGQSVHSISLHNPTSYGSYPLFKNFINAYDTDFFSTEKYISDSQMHASFSEKDPFKFVERAKTAPVQILMHPCQFRESDEGFSGAIRDYVYRTELKANTIFTGLL